MRYRLAILALAALAAGFAQNAAAQSYPNKPITVIVPFAAGGPTDVVTRIVGEHMSRTLGQQLIVENVGGAGGTTGMTRAAQAAPDGYTIAVGNMGTQSAAPSLYPNLKYDPATSFAQVGIVNFTPQAIVAKPATEAKDLKSFIAYLQANHQKLSYGHAGVGSISHVSGTAVQRAVRPEPGPRRLPRHRPGAQRPGRRPDRLHGRPVAQRHPADQGRHHQGLCHRRARASREPARRADHQGGRHRLHLQRLERDGRAQGHAQGDRRQAGRCARQGLRRSDHQGALRRARQHRADGCGTRSGRPAEAGRERGGAHHAGAEGGRRQGCRGREGCRGEKKN